MQSPLVKNNKVEGRGAYKRGGGGEVYYLFPRKRRGGDLFERGGLIEDLRYSTGRISEVKL